MAEAGTQRGTWAAVVARPQMEGAAVMRANDQGYQTCWPTTRTRTGRRVSLFPMYFFALIVDRWSSLNGTRGVIGVIMCGERPCPVPTAEIDKLRAKMDENGDVLFAIPQFKTGDAVRIIRGLLAGDDVLAEYLEPRGQDRARLLVRGHKIEMAERDIQLVA